MERPLTYLLGADSEPLLRRVANIAADTDRPYRPLLLQSLLQLPRVADVRGLVPQSTADLLIRELAQELPDSSLWKLTDAIYSPRALHFRRLNPAEANSIMETFHYLRSPREDSFPYGLHTAAGQLTALATSSPLDVEAIRSLLRDQGHLGEARVISRVFAFDGAPRNTISYLLAKIREEERALTSHLVTYVNPNMAFTGASYKASGWTLLGTEAGTKYRYLDHRYITDRRLKSRFGTCDDAVLAQTLGHRFSTSTMPLQPLLIFHLSLGTT